MLGIDGIQSVGFRGDLIEVVPDVMQFPHHGEEVRWGRISWDNAGNEPAQISFSGQTGSSDQPGQMHQFRLCQPDFDFIVSIVHVTPYKQRVSGILPDKLPFGDKRRCLLYKRQTSYQ